MVNTPHFHELSEEIYKHFEGKCVVMWQILDYAKKLGYKTPLKLVLFSMKYLGMNGKVFTYKFYDDYNVYCFGRQYEFEDLVDHKEVRKCIERFLLNGITAFNFIDVIECIAEKKTIGRNIIPYLAVLYELMKMVKEGKARYFVVTTDAKKSFRILVDREITTEDLQRKA
jgi:hypothetical protein